MLPRRQPARQAGRQGGWERVKETIESSVGLNDCGSPIEALSFHRNLMHWQTLDY